MARQRAMVGFPAFSDYSYRLLLCQSKFQTPVEIQSAKPFTNPITKIINTGKVITNLVAALISKQFI